MIKYKTVLISGCSSGLGLAMCQIFIQHGWKVLALTRDIEKLPFQHPQLQPILFSLNQASSMAAVLQPFLQEGLDLLINNAGYALIGAFETLHEDAIRQQMDVNFTSHVLTTQICLPALRMKTGKIFTLSSLFGLVGCPFHTIYCASKFALEGFSEALHYELRGQGIQCSVIEPGRYKTNFANNMTVISPNAFQQPLYQESYTGFLRLKATLSHKKANDISHFAHKIYQLAIMKNAPLRIQVDLDSKIPYLLKKLLPTRLFSSMQYKLFSKYFRYHHV